MATSYRQVQISSFATVQSGYAFKSKDWEEEGIPVVKIANVKDGRLSMEHCSHVSIDIAEQAHRYQLKEGDVLLSMTGYIGEVARVRTSERMLLNQRVGRFTIADREAVDPLYFFYALKQDSVKAQMQAHAYGAAQPNISPALIGELTIPLPPLEIQRKIACVLGVYDDLIENNLRRVQILEEMTELLYQEWFVRFRFPGHQKVRMVDSTIGMIPEGWEVGTVDRIARLRRRSMDPSSLGEQVVQHYSFAGHDGDRMPVLEPASNIKSNKYLLEDQCVLLSKLNPKIPRVWLPYPDVTHMAVASTEFLILEPRKPFGREFLFALCSSSEFLGEFAALALGTSTSHQRVKPGDLLAMPTLIPCGALVDSFRGMAQPIFALDNILRLQTANLRQTRDLLLPRLVSGELDVSSLDTDLGEVSA